MSDLLMADWLTAVRDHGIYAGEALQLAGHHPRVILSKAEKSSRKGYTEFGVHPTRAWLTPAGSDFLASS